MLHGGAVRIFNLVKRLADHAELFILIFIGGTDDPRQRAALSPYCRLVFFQRYPEEAAAVRDPWGLKPPSALQYSSQRVAERIAAIVEAHRIDLVLLEYTEMGQFAGPQLGAATALVEHDLSFRSHSRQRSLGIDRRYQAADTLGSGFGDWLRRYRFELQACDRANQIHVMSTVDGESLARLLVDGDRRIRVIPNGVDTDHYHPSKHSGKREGALFVGSFPHLPNMEAFDYLVSEIWPRVRQILPEARLTVAGARPPQRILELDGRDGIDVAGELPDLAPLYASHRLLLVPIRAGSGTRLKILEAMASGLPVLSTTIGAEGIECREGEELLIADTADGFAAAAAGLLQASDQRIEALSRAARRLAVERYDWERIADRLRAACVELIPTAPDAAAEHHEIAADQAPTVSIVIPVAGDVHDLDRRLAIVCDQDCEFSSELIAVDWGADDGPRGAMLRHGARIVGGESGRFDQGRAANIGAAAARGRVLVFLSPHAEPIDRGWLRQLVVPLLGDDAPAAVQGGIHAQLVAGAPRHDPWFTRESRRWRRQMDGVSFSLINAAIRRELWQHFPFSPGPMLSDRRWQRLLVEDGHLILPCWAAVVFYLRPLELRQLYRETVAEGRAWRELGLCYSLGDLLGDLRRPLPYLDEHGQAMATPDGLPTGSQRHFGRLRPLGLFLGNRLPRYNPR
jgi:glycosyltransferase involved in cell wall biosynthesis